MIATDLLVPADREETSAMIASSSTDHFRLIGAGTWRHLPEAASGAVPITSRPLDRILQYEPADLTITVEAGCPLDALQETLAEGGQFLPCDYPAAGTVGGLVATAAAGPLALGYGSVRERLLGLTVITADGKLARSGSRVVKSVAGFDIPKLYCGSFGTLGFIIDATFKVSPIPARTETLVFSGARSDIAIFATRLLGSMLRPTSLVATTETTVPKPGQGRVAVGIDGGQGRVQRLTDEITDLARRLGLVELDRQEANGISVPRHPAENDATLQLDLAVAREFFVSNELPGGAVADLGTGRILIRTGEPSDGEFASLESLLQAGNTLVAKRGQQVLFRRKLDPAAADLSRRIKNQFDPQDRFNRDLLETFL